MAEISSTTGAHAGTPTSDRMRLLQELDVLLEKYLHHFDQYQKVREALTSRFSAGYFSLAQAKFESQSRRTYGQDCYDGRMQALSRISVDITNESPRFSKSQELNFNLVHDPEKFNDATSSTRLSSDPLRWFGILIPRALREAKIEFTNGLENVLPLCNLNLEMEEIEIEIRRTRKRLGNPNKQTR